eukprot:1954282-Prymnesium_polylepis.2
MASPKRESAPRRSRVVEVQLGGPQRTPRFQPTSNVLLSLQLARVTVLGVSSAQERRVAPRPRTTAEQNRHALY